MSRTAKQYLYDIHYSAQTVGEYAAGKTLEDYLVDEGLRDQIEHRLIIICEAMRELDRTHSNVSLQFTNYRNIIRFRTFLVHLYYRIEDKETWNTATRNRPPLRSPTPSPCTARPGPSPNPRSLLNLTHPPVVQTRRVGIG